jgi:hypothetical protein
MAQPTFALLTPSSYLSQHFVRFEVQPGLWSYVLTGVAGFTFKGTGNGFNRKTLQLSVPIPGLPSGRGLSLVHWAPFVTLASISNDGPANNAAWAVDTFGMPSAGLVMNKATVDCQLAVRDVDGFILRAAYAIHLLGRIAPLSGPTH